MADPLQSLAIALHVQRTMSNRANQARGKQNGQEDLEEGKKDRSDEAVAGPRRVVRPVFHCQERAEGHDAA